MSRFRFDLATAADDADLRAVLRQTPMEGRIALTFLREPSWFAAAAVDGHERQVVACRDLESGHIIGFGCRSLRTVYIDSEPQTIGYLSSLRLIPEFRKQALVARGYAHFRKLHRDGKVPYYLTTIAEGNVTAMATLTTARAGLPSYVPAGKYHTLVIPLRQFRSAAVEKNVEIRKAVAADRPDLLRFLREEGRSRQYFPVPEAMGVDVRLPPVDEVWLATSGGQIRGVLGVCDQHPFRQTVVAGYRGALNWGRWGVNSWLRLRGEPPLPAPGEPFRFLTAAVPVTQCGREEVLRALLRDIVREHAAGPCSHLLLGLHDRDPLLRTVRPLAVTSYTTHLFLVGWEGERLALAAANPRVPYLELGTL